MSSPGQGSRAPAGADVSATLREMWVTRPARHRDDRKIAGVAAAVARRYAIDPTLVRVGFVVAAFYGVGLLLYLVGVLVLPRVDAEGRRREAPMWAIVVAAVLGMITVGGAVGGNARFAVGVAVALLLLYVLHRRRGAVVAPARPDSTSGPGEPAPAAEGAEAGPGGESAPRPPAWDPLGAAPFAWDLPEPAPPPQKRPHSWVAPVTLGAALLAVGVALGLGLLGLVPLGVTPVVGTALAVVGVGLVVGAFLHRGRGLLLAAVPLALVLVAASTANAGTWRNGPPWADRGEARSLGSASWAPTVGAVLPTYGTAYGDARLDLRGLAATPPGAPPVRTEVRSGGGDVTVLVPATADVTATCESGGGDVDCLGHGRRPVTDLGPDGPGGPVIDLHAASGGGDVEVRRG